MTHSPAVLHVATDDGDRFDLVIRPTSHGYGITLYEVTDNSRVEQAHFDADSFDVSAPLFDHLLRNDPT